MSFWTAIRDTFAAPVNAITGVVGDLTSGENVLDSVQRQTATYMASTQWAAGIATDLKPVHNALDAASPYTLGITGDFNKIGAYNRQVASGDDLNSSESWDYLKTTGKDAAIIYAGVAAGGALGGATAGGQAVAGYSGAGVGKNLLDGNYRAAAGGALSLGAGGFLPEGSSPFVEAAASFLPNSTDGKSRGGGSSGYASSESGYYDPYGYEAPGAASMILPLAAVAVGAWFLIKRRRA